MRRKLVVTLVAIVVVAYGSFAAMLATGTSPALGLDLQGGISVTQRAKPGTEYSQESLDLAVERIRERVDALGVAEPEILRQGDTIVVNLPGVQNQREAVELVQVTGLVYLRPVIGDCQDLGQATDSTDTTTPTESTTGGSTGSTTPTTSPSSSPPTTSGDSTGTTTGAPGPSRSITATNTTAPTTEPTLVATASPETTVAVTDTTVPTTDSTVTTETTEPPALDENGYPLQVSDPYGQQYLQLKGSTFYCPVGPAWNPEQDDTIEGTGKVFEKSANAAILQDGGWGVQADLRDGADGRDIWNAIASACFNTTAECPTGQLAIELDGIIQSNPRMNEDNFTGGVEISGSFTQEDAKQLAEVINSGSLPVQMQLESVQSVSPTLGEDSLRAAVISGLIGVALVLLFMILYYRLLGVIVAVGITVSATLLYSVVSLLSKTQGLALALSGIAGIIVSVGVTVDSYVVFFERLKDEVKSGKTMRNSAQRGFTGAWRTIVIADLVSLLGALVLWYLTVGAVRGFAFFLGLSTLTDLVVAYLFTRPTVLLLARTRWMERRKVMGIEAVAYNAAGGAS